VETGLKDASVCGCTTAATIVTLDFFPASDRNIVTYLYLLDINTDREDVLSNASLKDEVHWRLAAFVDASLHGVSVASPYKSSFGQLHYCYDY